MDKEPRSVARPLGAGRFPIMATACQGFGRCERCNPDFGPKTGQKWGLWTRFLLCTFQGLSQLRARNAERQTTHALIHVCENIKSCKKRKHRLTADPPSTYHLGNAKMKTVATTQFSATAPYTRQQMYATTISPASRSYSYNF